MYGHCIVNIELYLPFFVPESLNEDSLNAQDSDCEKLPFALMKKCSGDEFRVILARCYRNASCGWYAVDVPIEIRA